MPFARSGDVKLDYDETGQGPPIIFAHELASDRRQWRLQVAALSGAFRCIAYDARGYPPSDVPEADDAYGYQRFVDDIGALQDHLGLERCHLVGSSMGAYAALMFALQNPGRVQGVAACGVGSGSPAGEIAAFRAEMAALSDLYLKQGAAAGAEQIAAGANRQPLRRDHPDRWAVFLDDLRGHSAPGMARVCRNYQGRRPSLYDFADAFARMRMPVLVVVGEEDSPCLETSRFLAATIPGAELQLFPEAGHTPNIEAPETFNHVLHQFIDRAEAAPRR
jgi:pimeloyl-ACP methyl ester carboxylesterase